MTGKRTSIRLPARLFDDATAYAASLGITFNALTAVALADYLAQRPTPARSVTPASARTAAIATHGQPTAAPAAADIERPPGGVNAPCPCDSGRKWKHCHGRAQR